MNFDEYLAASCIPGNQFANYGSGSATCDPWTQGPGNPGEGLPIDPPPLPIDDRCADQAFADANPAICLGYPRLILKPSLTLTEAGKTVTYSTFLRTQGNEVELTSGLNYSSTDSGIAVISATAGIATGIQAGIITVGVKWQNLSAYAQLQVVASCADVVSKFFILIDNSLSSTVGFSSLFASRLNFAKQAAIQFVGTVNFSKDTVSVGYFNTDGTIVLTESGDQGSIITAINSIVGTSSKTNLHDGLSRATTYLDSLIGRKVLLFFSDGENNQGDDPIALANNWKGAGNVIITVALRAWGTFFDTLYKISSSGFFLSAYEATQNDVISTLQGLKTYLCSSDCHPTPGTFPTAQLNYTGFINWDVTSKRVDLCGLGLYDVLPSPPHGLYVDMSGTAYTAPPLREPPDVAEPGQLTSKVAFNFVSGKTYRFSVDVAGNNRTNSDNSPIHITIGTLLDQTIMPTAWNMPFTTYRFDFTPGSSGSAKITIEAVQTGPFNNQAAFIDNVSLTNVTDSITMLADDFDSENPTTIDPSYTYYGPCLVSPPEAQLADPTPPTPPIEN